jgi:hypothetical protein
MLFFAFSFAFSRNKRKGKKVVLSHQMLPSLCGWQQNLLRLISHSKKFSFLRKKWEKERNIHAAVAEEEVFISIYCCFSQVD